MFVDIVLLATAAVLVAGSYLFKRSAGTLILAAMAGGLMASLAAATAAQQLDAHGVHIQRVQPEAAVGIAITLLPALLVWFAGPKSHARIRRLIGAVVFASVVVALIAGYMKGIFAESLVTQAHVSQVVRYKMSILAVGLAFALIDLYLSKAIKGRERGRRK
ncbi:MAG TPA: hypothetical protein VLF60_00195 [Candidatus Saccharimonadales bacterium]|nr:hypothetical protein [Candidatus Saccharimonadales bacterium]